MRERESDGATLLGWALLLVIGIPMAALMFALGMVLLRVALVMVR